MKTFLSTALVLAAASSLGYAGTGSDGDKWSGLDQEIDSLAQTLGQGTGGPQVGALVRSALYYSDDDVFLSTPGGDDLLGWAFQDVELWAQGNVGDFFWRVSLDGATPGDDFTLFSQETLDLSTAGALGVVVNSPAPDDNLTGVEVEDAFGRWMFSESLSLTFGNFQAPATRSSALADENLLFIGRTEISAVVREYDAGVMLGGTAGNFGWSLAGQNGNDGTDEDYRLSARGQFNWNQGVGGCEGAYGAATGTNGAIGVFYVDEGDLFGDSLAEESFLGADALVTFGSFSVGGEVADLDRAEATLWNAVGSFLFSPEWEIAARYQEFDDVDDTTMMEFGLNFYQSGHNAKWQLNVGDVSSDVAANEGTILALGLTVGASS